jgi:hypothetical protein
LSDSVSLARPPAAPNVVSSTLLPGRYRRLTVKGNVFAADTNDEARRLFTSL